MYILYFVVIIGLLKVSCHHFLILLAILNLEIKVERLCSLFVPPGDYFAVNLNLLYLFVFYRWNHSALLKHFILVGYVV